MTGPGGDQPHRNQPDPWQPYQHPPVDPHAPIDYPENPYHPPPYGYGGPPPMYLGAYDPYQTYPPHQTNNLAVASLVTSITGVVLGIPLAVFCYVGWVIPVIGAVLGAVALNQIKTSGEQGRGMALAGIVIGSATAALFVLLMMLVAAAMFHSPMFMR